MEVLDKYFFVKSGGVQKSRKLNQTEELQKESGNACEIQKLGMEGMLTLEGSAASSSGATSSTSSYVKEEMAGKKAWESKVATLKAAVSLMQKLSSQGNTLKKRFEILGRQDPLMKGKGEELAQKFTNYDTFVDQAMTLLLENEEIEFKVGKGDDVDFVKLGVQIDKTIHEGDHHTGGVKEMLRRYSNMLPK